MKIIQFIMLAAGLTLALTTVNVTAADAFEIDPGKSKISFSIKNKPPNASDFQDVPGSFGKFTGTVVFDKADPSKSMVEIEVKTDSVDTGNKKRDDHLKNQDFFKVKEFPKMLFKSTKVSVSDGGKYEVEGNFTMLGKSKKIKVIFEPSGESGGKTSFQIKRSDYGMNYRVPDTADEVDITLEIVGKKK